MKTKTIFHVDNSESVQKRFDTFRCKKSYILQEGFLAKFCLKPNELNFIRKNNKLKIFPADIISTTVGVVDKQELVFDENDEIEVDFDTDFEREHIAPFYLIIADITSGYKRRCLFDIKIGRRHWDIGAKQSFVAKKKAKVANSIVNEIKIRPVGCEWYDDEGNRQTETREWGFDATLEEVNRVFRNYFKYPEVRKFFLAKLNKMYETAVLAREKYGMKFYSVSVLFSYDDADPTKRDIRLIDFEKCYTNVDEMIKKYSWETLEDTEDDFQEGIKNLIDMLSSIE